MLSQWHEDSTSSDAVRPSSMSIGGATSGHDVAALQAELQGLRLRQASQGVIEQAKGMLMAYYGITSDAAFAVLRRWSQQSNVKLRDLAAGVAAAGSQPSSRPFGALGLMLDTLADQPDQECDGRPVGAEA